MIQGVCVVPVVGIEPTRCHQQRILNPLDTYYSSLLLLTPADSTPCFCRIFSLGLVNSRLQEYAGMDQGLSYFYHTWGWELFCFTVKHITLLEGDTDTE